MSEPARAAGVLRRERDVADRLLVVGGWISRQRDRPADRAPDEALIVAARNVLAHDCPHRRDRLRTIGWSEAMYCAGVLTFAGGFMDSSPSRTKFISDQQDASPKIAFWFVLKGHIRKLSCRVETSLASGGTLTYGDKCYPAAEVRHQLSVSQSHSDAVQQSAFWWFKVIGKVGIAKEFVIRYPERRFCPPNCGKVGVEGDRKASWAIEEVLRSREYVKRIHVIPRKNYLTGRI